MQAILIVIGGKANKSEVVLNLPATIGRSREADLTVGHRMISRKHCETYLVDGLMMIRDVGSLNGTYVKGQRVREAPLPPGAKFTIGPITFRVNYEYSGDSSNLPPIIPADAPPSDETLDEGSASAADSAEAKTEPVKERPPAKKGKPGLEPLMTIMPSADVDATPLEASPLDDPGASLSSDEPDFEIVEEADDDFELAIEEGLEEDTNRKEVGSESDTEKDPEDQLMDDFLNDLQ